MEAQEILEGNKLIADFNEVIKCTDVEHKDNPCYFWGVNYSDIKAAKYHNNWNWLIPTVKKIEQKGFIVQITFCLAGSCQIWNHKGNRFICERNNPIEAVWETVVEFIKWHNDQT